MAQREIVADFVGQVLFKGAKNRLDIAQALSDEDVLTVGNIETSMDALEELAATDRNLFQKLWDIVKGILSALSGHKQTQRLVTDLEYIEKRFARVYDSVDINALFVRKNTSIQFSKEIHDYPYSMQTVIKEYLDSTDLRFVNFIEDARRETNKKRLEFMHFDFVNNINEKILNETQSILGFDISNYEIEINGESIHHIDRRHGEKGKQDQSMKNIHDMARAQYILTNADMVQQAINSKGEKATDSQYRDKNNNPSKILLFAKKINGTYCIALAAPESKKQTLHLKSMYFAKKIEDIQEFDADSPELTPKANLEISSIDSIDDIEPTVNTNSTQETENYSEDDQFSLGSPFDYAEELLSNPDNYELEIVRRQPERSVTQAKQPNTSNELPSNNSIPSKNDTVNTNSTQGNEKYSLQAENPKTIAELTPEDAITTIQFYFILQSNISPTRKGGLS